MYRPKNCTNCGKNKYQQGGNNLLPLLNPQMINEATIDRPLPDAETPSIQMSPFQELISKGVIEAPQGWEGTAQQYYDHANTPQKKDKIKDLQRLGIGLQGARTGLSWLAGAVERNRQNQFDMTQQTALGMMNPMQVDDFQPNPYNLYMMKGGKLTKIVKDYNKWSNDAGPMDMTHGEGNKYLQQGGQATIYQEGKRYPIDEITANKELNRLRKNGYPKASWNGVIGESVGFTLNNQEKPIGTSKPPQPLIYEEEPKFKAPSKMDRNRPDLRGMPFNPNISDPNLQRADWDMSKPSNWSITSPTGPYNEQETLNLPDEATWRAALEGYKNISTQQMDGKGTATGYKKMKKGGYEIDRMLVVRKLLPELLNLGRLGTRKYRGHGMKKGGTLTPNKAREILHDGTAHGQPLTDKQRKFFGAKSKGHTNYRGK